VTSTTSRVVLVLRVAYRSLITYMHGGKHSRSGYRSPPYVSVEAGSKGQQQVRILSWRNAVLPACLVDINGCWAVGANGSSTCHVEKLPSLVSNGVKVVAVQVGSGEHGMGVCGVASPGSSPPATPRGSACGGSPHPSEL
jgi:hypothetical protein